MRRTGPRPLSGAFGELVGELTPLTLLARVQSAWPDAAGGPLAAQAEPVSERSGLVTVRCRSATWAHELELLSRDLREQLNGALGGSKGEGPVTGFRFVVGRPSG